MKDSANSLVCLAFGWFAIREREFFATLRLVIPLSQILPDRRFRKWWPDAPLQALIGAFFGLL